MAALLKFSVRSITVVMAVILLHGGKNEVSADGNCVITSSELACVTYTSKLEDFQCPLGEDGCTTCMPNPNFACFHVTEGGESGEPFPGWETYGAS